MYCVNNVKIAVVIVITIYCVLMRFEWLRLYNHRNETIFYFCCCWANVWIEYWSHHWGCAIVDLSLLLLMLMLRLLFHIANKYLNDMTYLFIDRICPNREPATLIHHHIKMQTQSILNLNKSCTTISNPMFVYLFFAFGFSFSFPKY